MNLTENKMSFILLCVYRRNSNDSLENFDNFRYLTLKEAIALLHKLEKYGGFDTL